MNARSAIVVAGVAGMLAVAAGTFGAHGLEGRIDPDLLHTWEIGVRYHAYHAVAILALAGVLERLGRPGRAAVWAFAIGIVVFSGSLYALALSGRTWLGAITPIGGVSLVVGWVLIAVGGWSAK